MKKNPPLPNSNKKSSKIPPPKMPSTFKPLKPQQQQTDYSEQIISSQIKKQQFKNKQTQNDKLQEIQTPISKLLDQNIQALNKLNNQQNQQQSINKEGKGQKLKNISLLNNKNNMNSLNTPKSKSKLEEDINQFQDNAININKNDLNPVQMQQISKCVTQQQKQEKYFPQNIKVQNQIDKESVNLTIKRPPIPPLNKQKRQMNNFPSKAKSNLPTKPKIKKQQFLSQIKNTQRDEQQTIQDQMIKQKQSIQNQREIILKVQQKREQQLRLEKSNKNTHQNLKINAKTNQKIQKTIITQTPQKIKIQEEQKKQSTYSQLQQKLKLLSQARSKLVEDSSDQYQQEDQQYSDEDEIEEIQNQQKLNQIDQNGNSQFVQRKDEQMQNHEQELSIKILDKKQQNSIYDSNIAQQQNEAEYLPDQFLNQQNKNIKAEQIDFKQNSVQINKVPHIKHSSSLSNLKLIQKQKRTPSNKHHTIEELQDKVNSQNQLSHFEQRNDLDKLKEKKQLMQIDSDKNINSNQSSCQQQNQQQKEVNEDHEVYLKKKEKILAESSNLSFSISAQNSIYYLLKQFRQKKASYIAQIQNQSKINKLYEKQQVQKQRNISIIMNELSHKNKLILTQIQSKGLQQQMKVEKIK